MTLIPPRATVEVGLCLCRRWWMGLWALTAMGRDAGARLRAP